MSETKNAADYVLVRDRLANGIRGALAGRGRRVFVEFGQEERVCIAIVHELTTFHIEDMREIVAIFDQEKRRSEARNE